MSGKSSIDVQELMQWSVGREEVAYSESDPEFSESEFLDLVSESEFSDPEFSKSELSESSELESEFAGLEFSDPKCSESEFPESELSELESELME